MKDEKVVMSVLDSLGRLMEDVKVSQQKRMNKTFVSLKSDSSLKVFLGSFTKYDLDEIRKILNISGVSALKKAELIEVLNVKIKEGLPYILKKLTDYEYKLIYKVLKNGGILKYSNEYLDTLLYLRKYGILMALSDNENNKYIMVPSDIVNDMNNMFNQIEIIARIRLNEKLYRITKGLLYYFGIINFTEIEAKINSFFKEPVSMRIINDMLFEFMEKDVGIRLQGNYWCHEDVDDYEFIAKEIKKRPTLKSLPLTTDMVMKAGEDNFREWNKYDKDFYNFLINNFEISKEDAEDYIESIKVDFKNGDSFTNTMKEISETIEIQGLEQLQQIGALIQSMYNNSRQWLLKGNSPQEVKEMDRGKFQPIPPIPFNKAEVKLGRNDPCHCGSGKKYKNCCLNK